MDKKIIDEYEAREYLDNRKQYYNQCGYDDEKSEQLAYCDLQERYEIAL